MTALAGGIINLKFQELFAKATGCSKSAQVSYCFKIDCEIIPKRSETEVLVHSKIDFSTWLC